MARATARDGSESGAGTPAPLRRHSLTYCQRLHDPRDFERVYAARKAVHAPQVVLFCCPNGLNIARLGVSVGTKYGNAVRRNRIKRVFRAAFRQCRELLPSGYDYVLVPKKGVADYNTEIVRAALERIARGREFRTQGSK